MKKIEKKIAIILMFFLFLAYSDSSYAIRTFDQKIGQAPKVKAYSAVVMDAGSGEYLYEKRPDELREMASTTKIMTALVTLENISVDTIVTIDRETADTKGATIHLKEGEKISIDDLLYGLMLKSANDAAVALAKAVGGSKERFASMMNAKAKELNLENTNYKNPSGLHADGHYSTARDIAILSRAAMNNERLRHYANTKKHTIAKTNLSDERELANTNLLLQRKKVVINGVETELKLKGVNGLKTAHTEEAGYCVVVTAKRGDREYIAVILGSKKYERFVEAAEILEWAFDNYSTMHILSKNDIEKIPVKKGKKEKVKAGLKEDAYLSLPKGASENNIQHSIKPISNLTAPIKKGQKIGDLRVDYNKDSVLKIPIYAEEDVERGGLLSFLWGIYLPQILTFLVLAALAILIWRYYAMKKQNIEEEREKERKRKALELEMERLKRNRQKFMNYK